MNRLGDFLNELLDVSLSVFLCVLCGMSITLFIFFLCFAFEKLVNG